MSILFILTYFHIYSKKIHHVFYILSLNFQFKKVMFKNEIFILFLNRPNSFNHNDVT